VKGQPNSRLHSLWSIFESVDSSAPHSARMVDYWLGGKDNFPVDREVADRLRKAYPAVVHLARSNRHFLIRTVSWLATRAGIRQFLDIGSGLPTADNTHQVAQRVAPDSRVVYVDNDRRVLAHARGLLSSAPGGPTAYVEGSFGTHAKILEAAASTLDFSRPVAFILVGVISLLGNDQEVCYVIRQLVRAVVPGSYVVVADPSTTSPSLVAATKQYARIGVELYHLRGRPQLEQFFEGLDLVPPGIVSVPEWHPAALGAPGADDPDDREAGIHSCGGVGRKPS
jgi:ubiquinone/menaquinone biosynthesis C-methylase UbiE